MPQIMSGRSAFLQLLIDEGVTHLFGNPGTTELAVMDAISDYPQLKYVLGLQEAAVLAMADGFCRASGKLSACNLHCTPGLGNAMGALYNAKFSGSPILVTAGQYASEYGLQEPLLQGPMMAMVQPLVKWAVEAANVQELPRIVRRAAKIALTPPSGPVFIGLPADVLDQEAELNLGKPTRVDVASRPSDEAIRKLALRLLATDRPVLIAGQEIASGDAFDEACELAELLGAAVFQEPVSYNARFPSSHPACLGDLTRNQLKVRETLQAFDLLVCLGADLLRMSAYSEVVPLPEGLPVIHLSNREWELGKNYSAELAICADVKQTLRTLLPVLRTLRTNDFAVRAQLRMKELVSRNWTSQREVARKKTASKAQAIPAIPIDPHFLMMNIADNLPDTAVVVEEAPTSAPAISTFVPMRDPRSFYGLASGGLGFGLAGAVGISLAQPGRPIMALIGDGSVMYGVQALWTAAHLRLPITYVIINNRSYRILKDRMVSFRNSNRFVGMDLTDPEVDFKAVAKGFGVPASRIDKPGEIGPAIRAAIASGGPSLIDVTVDAG